MSDLISRQAVIDRINRLIEVEKKQGTDDWGYGRERVNAYEAMLHFVGSEYLHPSVEPERKMGHWIHDEDWECSVCHSHFSESKFMANDYGTPIYNYCPICGADLTGV